MPFDTGRWRRAGEHTLLLDVGEQAETRQDVDFSVWDARELESPQTQWADAVFRAIFGG